MTSKDQLRKEDGHLATVPDRADRVFQKGEHWYFHTRENVQIGPFDNKELAIRGANDYVGFALDADPARLDEAE